jgi:hypothetical protein
MQISENALDRRARTAAKRVGLSACKARGRHHLNNKGGYMLFEPYSNTVVYADDYGLSAQEVIEICHQYRSR